MLVSISVKLCFSWSMDSPFFTKVLDVSLSWVVGHLKLPKDLWSGWWLNQPIPKNISQNGFIFPKCGVKKNVWNHHQVMLLLVPSKSFQAKKKSLVRLLDVRPIFPILKLSSSSMAGWFFVNPKRGKKKKHRKSPKNPYKNPAQKSCVLHLNKHSLNPVSYFPLLPIFPKSPRGIFAHELSLVTSGHICEGARQILEVKKEMSCTLRIIGPSYGGVWMCVAGVWDLQTTSIGIPWFLGHKKFDERILLGGSSQ